MSGRVPRCVVAAVVLGAALITGTTPAAEDNGGFVKPGQPLRDLRGKEAGPASSSPEVARFPAVWSSDSIRVVGLASVTAAGLAVLLLLRRRRRLRAGATGATRLEILDRIALSTRQWVCILRVDEKRIVVGVSGDSMTSLAVLDGPPPPPGSDPGRPGEPVEGEGGRREGGFPGPGSGFDRGIAAPRESTRRDEGTFWFRPGGTESGVVRDSSGGASWENHLAPYRREVTRLRDMLQNWGQTTDRGESAEPGGTEERRE